MHLYFIRYCSKNRLEQLLSRASGAVSAIPVHPRDNLFSLLVPGSAAGRFNMSEVLER